MIQIIIQQTKDGEVQLAIRTESGHPVPLRVVLNLIEAAENAVLSAGIPTQSTEEGEDQCQTQ